MKKCLVTGSAGFIGSHLARRLLAEGCRVLGVDCFTDYYPRRQKESNIADLLGHPSFSFLEADLRDSRLDELVEGRQWVFHQAAQAGVRASWGAEFAAYTDNNVLATQRLLEACVRHRPEKFIYASSSSVYGEVETLPAREDALPAPVSPYGVTKLAAEHLCRLYWRNFGLPTVSLRYFTVYGPGQRPDMAFHRFLRALALEEPLHIFGDGSQSRDFTYVSDAVEANILAAMRGEGGEVFNIGGGHRCTLNEVISVMERVSGRRARVLHEGVQKGDVRHTLSDTARARERLGFSPSRGLEEGLGAQWEWVTRHVVTSRGGD